MSGEQQLQGQLQREAITSEKMAKTFSKCSYSNKVAIDNVYIIYELANAQPTFAAVQVSVNSPTT